jgi:hypothetical protein
MTRRWLSKHLPVCIHWRALEYEHKGDDDEPDYASDPGCIDSHPDLGVDCEDGMVEPEDAELG